MHLFSSTVRGSMVLVVLAVALLAAPQAHAFVISVGAVCQLNRDVSLDIKTGQGRMRVPLVKGKRLTIVVVTAVSSRVQSGNLEGMLDNSVLEDACSYAVETCTLKNPIKISERMDGEGKAWRIKPGGKLEILARGSPWSTVRIGPVEGFVEASALLEQCPAPDAEPVLEDDGAVADDDDDVDLGDDDEGDGAEQAAATPLVLRRPPSGTRVLLLPILLDGRRDDGLAALYEDTLTATLTKKRGDAAGPSGKRPNARSRSLTTKQVLIDLVPAARDAGLTHLIIAELTFDTASADSERRTVKFDDEDVGLIERRDLLVVTVFDIAHRKVTKRLKVPVSLEVKDTWPDRTLEALTPVLPTQHTKQPAK
jgi:hypothetical protein